MTPHPEPLKTEVGVRELHDRLSRYVQHVQDGAEVVVTMRGRRVARLIPVDEVDPLADLRARGLVREPTAPRSPRTQRARVKAARPVSTSSQTNGADRLLRYVRARQADLRRTRLRARRRAWDRADILVS